MSTPKLRMIAGPNGSGKSTFLNYLCTEFAFPVGYCLNPDELDIELGRHGRLYLGGWGSRVREHELQFFVQTHPLSGRMNLPLPRVRNNVLTVETGYEPAYLTAILADFLRKKWLAASESFTFETVMSHPDKRELVEEAKRVGYRTYLYYICTDSIVINRARIQSRVEQGGHDVPADKVESRYDRSLKLLATLIPHTNRANFFDNSTKSHNLVAEFESGRLRQVSKELPGWFVTAVLDRMN